MSQNPALPISIRSFSQASADYRIWQIIAASAAGTMVEWYDFYIFGSLATIISLQFYPKGNATAAFLATLATFATGFAVRPFGAVFFGRIGDLVGRKYAFLVTLLIMGLATTAIGFLPTYASIGVLAPILLVLIRLLQGLALGGEYGGAAIYVAEHVPDHQRGFFTSFIQITASLGLFVSLAVILVVRRIIGETAFGAWGWRLPFLISFLLVGVSLYIRLRMRESPIFIQLKKDGKTSTAPVRESFGNRRNWKLILLALFGATAGQGVVWYTGQFYALFFLQNTLKVDYTTSTIVVAAALALGMPFFVVFGALSDRVGRKRIMLAGNLIAALAYVPIYYGMKTMAGPIDAVTKAAAHPNMAGLIALVFIQVIFVTMVYGPIAAFLVELFPARIRYSSLSLPYHIGNGVFGGLVPLISTSLVLALGNIYAGLIYPIAIALLTVFISAIYLHETHEVRIWDELHNPAGS